MSSLRAPVRGFLTALLVVAGLAELVVTLDDRGASPRFGRSGTRSPNPNRDVRSPQLCALPAMRSYARLLVHFDAGLTTRRPGDRSVSL